MHHLLSGIWRSDQGSRYAWYGATWPNFAAKHQELSASGFVLLSLEIADEPGGVELWSGVWESGAARQELISGLAFAALLERNAAMESDGFGLVALRSHGSAASRTWVAVWRKGLEPCVITGAARWSAFWETWLAQHAAGRRLLDLDCYEMAGTRLWSAAWRGGSGDQYMWVDASWDSFWGKHRELRADGYELRLAKTYSSADSRLWAGHWQKGLAPTALVVDLTEQQFWREFDDMLTRGMRLVAVQEWGGTAHTVQTAQSRLLRLHLKILFEPSVPIATMLDRMRQVVEPIGVGVEVGSIENLEASELIDLDAGTCSLGMLTPEQTRIYSLRRPNEVDEIVVYFVRSTLPPYNGCAAHPTGSPGLVIASYATEWTLAHEVGHVLGLSHVAEANRLMTSLGTTNIVDPPPDLSSSEVQTILSSPLVVVRV